MADNSVYHGSDIDSVSNQTRTPKMGISNDTTTSTDILMVVFNLCNDMAKKIKDEAVSEIENTIYD